MEATVGDKLLVHGRVVGRHDRTAEIVEAPASTATRRTASASTTTGTRP